MNKNNLRGKDLFGLHLLSHRLLRDAKAGTQSRNLEAGTKVGAMEGLFTLFSYILHNYLPSVVLSTMGQAFPH